MIEVNLFSISSSDPRSTVGRCVARSRYDIDTMGVSVMEYVKKFLQDNLDTLESGISGELVSLINSEMAFTTKDFMSINYLLSQVGYSVRIWNVADDEENPLNVPDGGVYEINVVDKTYVQHEYPTSTKIMSASDESLVENLDKVVESCGLFNPSRFNGLKNPLTDLISALKREKNVSGNINATIVTRLYQVLGDMGFELFYAASEA